MATYPEREPFFAHRYIRMLFKTCTAQTIGQDAVLLLTCIAHTEDAKRYSGPVSYYNGQLMPLLGMAKWDRLKRARDAAIGCGFLHYENHGRRSPGIYWVLVPDDLDMPPDTPLDEGEDAGFIPSEGYKQGYKQGYKAGMNEGINRGIKRVQTRVQSGYERGYKQGEPSTLYPDPIPRPLPKPFPSDTSACADVSAELNSAPLASTEKESLSFQETEASSLGAASKGKNGKPEKYAENIRTVIAVYQEYHPRSRPGEKEKTLVRNRLKEGYTVSDLSEAIHGNHRSPFHCGENDGGKKYHSLSLIFRDSAHVQQFMEVPYPGEEPVMTAREKRNQRAADSWLSRYEDQTDDPN